MAEAQAQIYKIYKITSPQTDKIYIGSTKQQLKHRFSNHKSDAKNKGKYYSSFDLIKNYSDCEIELIEEVDKQNRLIRERHWIEFYEDKCVNERIPIRTKEETREHQREYDREFYEVNKVQIKERNREYYSEKITCECGVKTRKDNISKHRKTKRHLKFVESITAEQLPLNAATNPC